MTARHHSRPASLRGRGRLWRSGVVAATALALLTSACAPDPADRPVRSSAAKPGTPARTGAGATGGGSGASGAHDGDPSGNSRLLAEHGPPPLDAWGWTPADAATVASAVEELTARCMAAQGFTYDRPAGGAPSSEPVTHWGGFLGLVSAERARATGYQVLDVQARLAERARLEQEATRAPDPGYVTALTGEAPGGTAGGTTDAGGGGCSGWAFAQVTPEDPAVDPRIQEELYGQALDRAAREPAVVQALGAWTGCMERRGYAIDAVPLPASTDPVTPELVAQAVADVSCKDETGLVGTYVTALYDAERDLAAEHRAELDAFAAWGRERVRLATQALAG